MVCDIESSSQKCAIDLLAVDDVVVAVTESTVVEWLGRTRPSILEAPVRRLRSSYGQRWVLESVRLRVVRAEPLVGCSLNVPDGVDALKQIPDPLEFVLPLAIQRPRR
jgi:hypothetical protein